MEDQVISFKTAKLAKEKGFDVPCLQSYRVWRENLRKSETEEEALSEIDVEYDRYTCDCYAEVKYLYQDSSTTLAPTQSLLQKWLRETHNLAVVPHIVSEYYVDIIDMNEWGGKKIFKGAFNYEHTPVVNYENMTIGDFPTWEEALEVGLQEALKLIK